MIQIRIQKGIGRNTICNKDFYCHGSEVNTKNILLQKRERD